MREKIMNDLKNAMKNQNKDLLAVVRMVKGAMQLEEIKLQHELSDDEVITVIAKQLKMRKESLVDFEKAKRNDLIDQANREIEILNRYLPKQMDEEEIKKVIDQVFAELNPTAKDMGKIMGKISPILKGKADMGLVNKLIKDKLGV